ncbi:rna-directed dna polymerase from mobile element jockey-like [Willisornis vidua]|uniref:Rna-directed dna polymerase from mobile element jockey-like n=1 Tax=Willisornis vidua TaxID=1566151 RepID=A0ABQ9CMJ5_9PASS|nr:rna-directed dna polymerase from mobile element jockey-like [Willisornis vidua]
MTLVKDAVDSLEEGDTIQRDLDRLQESTCANHMKFNKVKCKVLHLNQRNPQQQFRLGDEWIEGSPAEKDLGILMDTTLGGSQQYALPAHRASGILGCIQSRVGSRAREDSAPLLCIQLLGPQHRKDVDLLD